ncbi:MAG: hybrid sensor histidine kinase/response regulator [Acidobacteria bacterium]|nr:hybrid sensor histidine kinase/response regulator [Acidobacteriota bacterium]
MEEEKRSFLEKLLATFKVEAAEHIHAISSGLIALEKASAPQGQLEIVEVIFREAHSLKGAARAVNSVEIESICQSLESVFSALKNKGILLSPALFDLLHRAVDMLGQLLQTIGSKSTGTEKVQLEELVHGLENMWNKISLSSQRKEPKTTPGEDFLATEAEGPPLSRGVMALPSRFEGKPILADTVRISVTKLDPLFLQTEELLSAKLTARQRATDLHEINVSLATRETEWARISPVVRTIQHSSERPDEATGPGKKNSALPKLLEFLEWENTFVKSLEGKLAVLAKIAERDSRALGGMVDSLLEDMKRVLMLPFSTLLENFPKFVRDLSRDRGKEVDLVIQGSEIEADKRILEEMKDPLVHLVRNCIDHGIESPEERTRKKKPTRGKITLAISPKNSSKVEVLISDDGAGINVSKVRAAAIKLGLISEVDAQKLNEKEALSLIYQSGVSTSPLITDISGRGLGLAIVQEKVERLGGTIQLDAQVDVGTTFRIVLPLTLATFRGVLVRVGAHLFVIPASRVEQIARIAKNEFQTVENRETIQLKGQAVSLVRLADALGLPREETAEKPLDKVPVVVLGSAERRIAFSVDEVLNEQEVLVKSLGKQLSRVRNISGATVLGTGKLVPILNVTDLMQSAVRASAGALPRAPVAAPAKREAKKKSVLVVEDSITSRTLLKNILEAAGYEVRTAVDGVDGYTQLRTEQFDLVVSDVDMPRMNGFDLTAKIRSDKKFAELPVVLVTALESREDRERGIDVGASAYIVKSSFDQSNLLEVVRRLA